MFEQEICGCPKQTSMYPYRCYTHAQPRLRMPNYDVYAKPKPYNYPTLQETLRDSWTKGDCYQHNTCRFCGRVQPLGLACSHVETCELCGIRSCQSHNQACFLLNVHCPKQVNKRTKAGKALLKAIDALVSGLREER